MSQIDRDDLPLPDYDHLPLESLRQRIRTLDVTELSAVLAYERAHGDRLPAVQAMERRLDQLRDGASPSGGDPAGIAPERAGGPNAPRQTDGSTDAPPVNPPSHGDPTNPAQPR
ncbi:MAG: uncharacterized protein JWQ59_454 [Cryobacterium sp.]|nr:uncharacterized protein [Cryobacterium sp.]